MVFYKAFSYLMLRPLVVASHFVLVEILLYNCVRLQTEKTDFSYIDNVGRRKILKLSSKYALSLCI